MKSSWKRTFAIIWSGQLFSSLSSSVVGFAVSFWMSIETGSAEVLAFAMMATLLPSIILGPFTGVFVDRWDRKKTMIFSDSFVALCSLALAFMFYFNFTELWLIYILLGLRSVGDAFHTPAMLASVPLLAPKEELMRVAGLNQMIHSASNIAGPALGAVCVAVMDMSAVIMLDVVGAVIACVALLFVIIPNPEKPELEEDAVSTVWKEVKEGIHHLTANKGLNYMLGLITVAIFFLVPISAMYPLLTTSNFGGGEFEMGVVEMCWGVGMFAGGFFVSTAFMRTANRVIAMNITAIVIGAAFWATGVISPEATNAFNLPIFIPYVLFTAMTGVGSSIYWSSFTVLLQTSIEPHALGRVFSIYDSVSLLPTIPGLLATGFVADAIGLPTAFIIAGIVVSLVGVVGFFIPSVRRLGTESTSAIKRGDVDLDEIG